MKPTLTHGKRLRPDSQRVEPASKRHRKTEAPSIISPKKIALSASQQEAIRLLQLHFQSGSSILDLSLLDPATLQSLPFSMVRNFVAQVRSLTLPQGMQCLPLICSAMPELQALHAPDFNGMTLDLSGLPRLRNLTGSAGAALKEIHLPLAADIDFRSDQKLCKIRVWRYQDGRVLQQHPLPSHTYYKTLPGKSAPDFSPLNFQARFADDSESIVCRHLSNYVLEQLLSPDFDPFSTEGYLGLTGVATLPQKILPDSKTRFHQILTASKHYHFVDDTSFATWASAQFTELETAVTLSATGSIPLVIKKGFLALSCNHALVCLLAIKPGPLRQYAIVLYDPNPGLTHQRRIATRIEELTQRQWRFSELLDAANCPHYFAPGHQPVLCMIEPEQRSANELAKTHYAIEIATLCNHDLLAGAVINNLPTEVMQIGFGLLAYYRAGTLSAQQVFDTLKGRQNTAATPWHSALYAANGFGQPHMVTAMMAVLKEFAMAVREKAAANGSVADGLPDDFCLQLLKLAAGWDLVLSGQYEMNSLALQALCSKTLELASESLISGAQCVTLLASPNAHGTTCMETALAYNHSEDLRHLGACITTLFKNDAIAFEYCLALLDQTANRPAAPQDAIETLALMACKYGWSAALEVYADVLIALASTAGEKLAFTGVSISDRLTAQILGAVTMASVQAMMQVAETGEQFRTTLQQFLLRLTDAGVLVQGNALSALCAAEAPPLPLLPQQLQSAALPPDDLAFDDYFFDDGQFPF